MIDLVRAVFKLRCSWCSLNPYKEGSRIVALLYNNLVPDWWVLNVVGKPWTLGMWANKWHWLFHVPANEYVERALSHEMDCEMCLLLRGDKILGTNAYPMWRERWTEIEDGPAC